MDKEKKESPRRKLLMEKKNGYDRMDAAELEAMEEYSSKYLKMMNAAKTEREFVKEASALAEEAGFKPLVRGEKLSAGD